MSNATLLLMVTGCLVVFMNRSEKCTKSFVSSLGYLAPPIHNVLARICETPQNRHGAPSHRCFAASFLLHRFLVLSIFGGFLGVTMSPDSRPKIRPILPCLSQKKCDQYSMLINIVRDSQTRQVPFVINKFDFPQNVKIWTTFI
jgi:hypothetical protein